MSDERLRRDFDDFRAKLEFSLPAFASIHVHDNTTAQSIPTGATYTKSTAFADNGYNLNCTADASNDKITITQTGYYQVQGAFCFSAGNNNTVWRLSLFVDGVEFEEIHVHRKISSAGDVGASAFTGIILVSTVPIDIDVRARHDSGGAVNLTITYGNLSIAKIAPA